MQRLLSGKTNSKKLTQQTSFGCRSKSSKEGPKRQSLTPHEQWINSARKCSKVMNDYFSNTGEKLANKIVPNPTTDHALHFFRVTQTLSDFQTNIGTFTKAFKGSVKPGKAGGHDNIPHHPPPEISICTVTQLYRVFTRC